MIYEDSALPIRARLKAVELLCKMYGDFLERVVIKDEPVKMPVINFVYTDDDEQLKDIYPPIQLRFQISAVS